MNKAVFLDRDGTINVDFGYVHTKDKLEFVPGVLDALSEIHAAGFKLIITTNQSGIGRGYFSLEQYKEFEMYMLEQMEGAGVPIDGVYVCPHEPQDQCDCRKPKTGLYERAANDFDIDWKSSYVVGDNERDLAVCSLKGIQGIFYGETEIALDCVVKLTDWKEIAAYILYHG